jgi:hypothetical protein
MGTLPTAGTISGSVVGEGLAVSVSHNADAGGVDEVTLIACKTLIVNSLLRKRSRAIGVVLTHSKDQDHCKQ